MNRGRARSAGGYGGRTSRSGARTSLRYVPVGAGRHSTDDDFECKDETPPSRMEAPKQPSPGGILKQSEHELTLGYAYEQDQLSSGNKGLYHMGRNQHGQNSLDTAGSSSQPSGCSSASDSIHENYLPPGRNMNRGHARSTRGYRGRTSRSGVRAPLRYEPVGAGRHSTYDDFECKDGTPLNRMEAPKQPSPGGISKQSEHEIILGYAYKQDQLSSGNKGLYHLGRNLHGQNSLDTAGSSSQPSGCSSASDSTHENHLPPSSDLSLKVSLRSKHLQNESQIQMTIKYGINNMPSQNKGPQFGKSSLKNTIDTGNIEHSEHPGVVEPFDTCPVKTGTSIVLKSSFLSKNREKQNESKQAAEGQKGIILRSGMVPLKSSISSRDQVGAGRHSTNDDFECKDGTPPNRMEAPEQPSPGGISKQSEHELTLGYAYEQDQLSSGNKGLYHMGRNQHGQNSLDTAGSSSQPSGCSSASDSIHENHLPPLSGCLQPSGWSSASDSTHENYLPPFSDLSLKENTKDLQNESQIQMPIKYGINNMPSQNKGPQFGKSSLNNTIGTGNIEHSEHPGVVEPFDICQVKTGTSVVLKSSLLSKNREKRNESKRAAEGQKRIILRSGMVLLKSYISSRDQVEIVKKCQELGLGSGGFYQPGYRDGAKLNLKMMCLGKNWDPETSKYGDERLVDHARPPLIPDEFYQLVKEAIQDSHALLAKEKIKASKVEEILPWMTPNICIVNFYSTSGRLGLHQDRDERQESLRKGLPVVSFSIGDSAEFLYSDQRDAFNADKVLLESGDVLIFGGESRHIFHGVTSILPNTSPKVLLEEANLRPGRLNLTFREY